MQITPPQLSDRTARQVVVRPVPGESPVRAQATAAQLALPYNPLLRTDDIELTADTPEPPEPPDDAGAPSPDAPKLGSEAAPDDTMLSVDALKPPIGSVSPVLPW